MVPASSAELLHDQSWFVAGLKGSGGCDFAIDELFRPAHLRPADMDAKRRRAGLLPPITTGRSISPPSPSARREAPWKM